MLKITSDIDIDTISNTSLDYVVKY